MILPVEYSWLESYLDNDSLWLEDSLNWEYAFDIALSDFTIYGFLTTPFFNNSQFFLDYFTKISFLDILFLLETDKDLCTREFYDMFIWDITTSFSNKYLPLNFLFYTDYQDFIVIVMYYNPELILAFNDFVNTYWVNYFLNHAPAVAYDLFHDSINASLLEFSEYIILLFAFIWSVAIFINIFHILKWNNPLEIYLARFLGYLYNISKESRVQFESLLQTFFFFVFYWSMLIATFDDDQEELIEIFDNAFFFFFCSLITFLIYKYSIHYFAFLEASVAEGKKTSYIAKQFFRDFINSFALFLRFFILLFRLNVYDTLDDFYDSYYIFVGDFDDDEYMAELFFSMYGLLFFDPDISDDRAFSIEDESDFVLDLFCLYFTCWAKFFTFGFFIIEEILRLALGFYLCYLIIFEVHSVNGTYVEDDYFETEKKVRGYSYFYAINLKF